MVLRINVMNYLVIEEDGCVSGCDTITDDMKQNIADGYITVIRYKDNNFESLDINEDGDEAWMKVVA